jgi:hypothetical protein
MNIERIATVVFAVEGAGMVTATRSAHETELAGRLGRGAGDKISTVLDAEKRRSAACQFERALRQKIVGQELIQPKDKPVTDLNQKSQRTAVEAAGCRFASEFMNRLDTVVVFHPLKREELDEVLEIELGQVQKRVLDSTTRPFLFRITNEGRQFVLQERADQRYGARHLKRAIERYLVGPLSRLLANAQVHQGDVLLIDRRPGEGKLTFLRDAERRPPYSHMPFVTPNSRCLTTAEARG